MMFRKLPLIFLFIIFLSDLPAQEYNYRFHTYTTENGLPSLVVNSILEDSYGFIWVGTTNGLSRFDAYTFNAYSLQNKRGDILKDLEINSLNNGDNDLIWVGTNEGLFHFNTRTEKSISVIDSVAVNAVVIKQNIIWIGTDDGLIRYDIETENFEHISVVNDDISNAPIFDLLLDNNKKLWISTVGHGLLYLNEGVVISYNTSNGSGISSNYTREIEQLSTGEIAVGTEDSGLNILNTTTQEFKIFNREEDNQNTLSSNSAYSLLVDSKNQLWIGTWAHGLNLYDDQKNTFERFTANPDDPTSIPNNFIKCLYQSSDGTLWIGTEGRGLARFNENEQQIIRFTHNTQNENSISRSIIKSVYEQEDGTIWIGTSQAGLNRYDPATRKFKTYLSSNGSRDAMARGTIWSISSDGADILWLGTSRGIGKLNVQTDEITFITPQEKGLLGNNVLKVLDDGTGNLWAGSWYGGLNKMDIASGSFEQFTHDPTQLNSIASNNVNDILIDNKNQVWVATSESLSKLSKDGKSFKNYPFNTLMIAEDKNQNLWLSTTNGLAKLSLATDSLYFFTENDSLSTTKVNSIIVGGNGDIWLGSNLGIDVFSPGIGVIKHLDKADGLVSNNIVSRANYKGKSGNFYFGGNEGLSQIDPMKLDVNFATPKIQFTNLLLFNKPVFTKDSTFLTQSVHTQKEVTLDYTDYIFAFEFAALDFNRAAEVTYEYQLEGFDKGWISTFAQNRKAVYTNVPAGNYTLKVRSKSVGSKNSTQNSIGIIITPPWWRTWWAQIISYGSLVLLIVAIFRIRFAVIKKQKHLLELEVKTRTSEIEKQKKELEDQAQQLQGLNEQKDKLFSIVSHDLRNPLATLKGTVSLLDPQILRDEDLEKIRTDIGERIEGVTLVILNLLDWSRSQMAGETTNPEAIDLFALAERKIRLFSDPAKSKKITLNNNFPKGLNVYADVNQVRTIFRNVLGNAIKFSKEGGVIQLNAAVNEKAVTIEIKDHGTGMNEDKIKTLFSLETNISTPGTSGEKGVGLGTLLIKEYAEKNGGNVWVESAIGKGTSVFFTLPLA